MRVTQQIGEIDEEASGERKGSGEHGGSLAYLDSKYSCIPRPNPSPEGRGALLYPRPPGEGGALRRVRATIRESVYPNSILDASPLFCVLSVTRSPKTKKA